MFEKLLIANRGEIARRIAKTCSRLGVATVAVFSEADTGARHVEEADEAFCIGPPPVSESYLNIDKLVDVAVSAGCDAVHPGYGLLSENAAFIERIESAGLRFVGPSRESVEMMGDKQRARAFAANAGVPIVPGSDAIETEQQAIEIAENLGYPVLVKAAAGGGGIGMKVANKQKALLKAVAECRRRGESAFGSDKIYLERYIENPRHVEIQVLADKHGNAIHLFERECSIQRRHQKVIEEAPSVLMTRFDGLREHMTEASLALVRAANYFNAGTLEYIVDENGSFYFIEMNTRLQVEHAVTELVTGVDLVEWQLRIAADEVLTLDQGSLTLDGHAIECRIYAENPNKMFLPAPGTIGHYHEPVGVRVDSGVKAHWAVTPHYDPMIAKLSAHGETRTEATATMLRALKNYEIEGLMTNLDMHMDVLNCSEFQKGAFHTLWLEQFVRAG